MAGLFCCDHYWGGGVASVQIPLLSARSKLREVEAPFD